MDEINNNKQYNTRPLLIAILVTQILGVFGIMLFGTLIYTSMNTDTEILRREIEDISIDVVEETNSPVEYMQPSDILPNINGNNYSQEHPVLGVYCQDFITQNNPTPQGAMIVSVLKGSNAEAANLQPGVIITAVDDTLISSAQDLQNVIASHSFNEVITLHIIIPTTESYIETDVDVTLK